MHLIESGKQAGHSLLGSTKRAGSWHNLRIECNAPSLHDFTLREEAASTNTAGMDVGLATELSTHLKSSLSKPSGGVRDPGWSR